MKVEISRRVLLIAALVAGTAAASNAGHEGLLEAARESTQQLIDQLAGEVRREYEMSGTVRTTAMCKYLAPEVSSSISRKFGAQVRRVSLRVRNPALGTPDAWEQTVLMEFERRLARGEAPHEIDFSQIVEEPRGTSFRYMKAIPVSDACIACHGPVEAMTPTTSAQLAAEYPHDQATGYRVGSIRGAVSFKKPL